MGLFLILPFGASANVMVEWQTVKLGAGVNRVESMWEISDAAAAKWFGFNPDDVIDFYFKIVTDKGEFLFTDENITRIRGGSTPFHIDPDQQLHTPGDVGLWTTAGDGIGWYSDPMEEQGPTEYASYVWFHFDGYEVRGYATGQWMVVPEPPIHALMLVGLIGVGIARRLKAQT
jgi:hypothetical protein